MSKPVPVNPDEYRGLYEVKFRDRKFTICTATSAFPVRCLQSFFFEAEVRERWWDIREGDVVVDVGAAYGSYTLPALVAGASLVVAFEPGRSEYFDLNTNLLINGYGSRVCLTLNVLAGAENGLEDAHYRDTQYPNRLEARPVVTIDHLVGLCGLDRLDWFKVDVEGDEAVVLRGALQSLDKFHPRVLLENHLEYAPEVEREVAALLYPLGYREEATERKEGSNENWSLWTWYGRIGVL